MTRKGFLSFAALSILSGAAAGLAVTVLVASRSASQIEKPSEPVSIDMEQLARDMETRLGARRALIPAAPAQVVPQDPAQPREPVTDPAPSVSREELLQEFRVDLENHTRDSRDLHWAAQAEAAIGDGVKAVSGSQKLVGVECRTTSCVATIEWPTRAQAANEFRNLLTADYRENCSRKILLHETEQAGPFQEKLILDCTEARTTQ